MVMPCVARLGCKISCEIKRADWELLFSSAENKGSAQKIGERKDFLFFFLFFTQLAAGNQCQEILLRLETWQAANTEWDAYMGDEHTL